jgi:hypothetical protein
VLPSFVVVMQDSSFHRHLGLLSVLVITVRLIRFGCLGEELYWLAEVAVISKSYGVPL